MSNTQTVRIPAGKRQARDIPREVPAEPVVLAFTPSGEAQAGGLRDTPEYLRRKAMESNDTELFNLYADELNREAADVLLYQIDPFELIPPYEEDL